MTILGLSCYYHEAAAAILVDGQIAAAAAQERFSRQKHDAGFPQEAIDFCLGQAGLKAGQLDYVVFYEKPLRKFERIVRMSMSGFPLSRSLFVDGLRNLFAEKLWIKTKIASQLGVSAQNILFVPHHASHAAASFYPSPFERAAILTLDGVGEWTTGAWGVGDGHRLKLVGEMRFPHSVGLLYSTMTAYLSFRVNDGEYKVMGMAGYGKPRYVDRIKKFYRQHSDGSIRLNLDYFSFQYSSRRMYSDRLVAELVGLDRFDIAASLQACTEEIILTMTNKLYETTGETNLVFGGGVALNSVANGLLTRQTAFKKAFVFPAAGDDGGAVGAALYVYHHVLGHPKRFPLKHVFWGPSYRDDLIETWLKQANIVYKKYSTPALVQYVAGKLSQGQVVGWFEGRGEFGPRALGHRSILADPRNSRMKETVNGKIKLREEFRPFAPAVLAEPAKRYFSHVNPNLSPWMLGTFRAKAIARLEAPATVHVDGTSRIQTVPKDFSGRFRKVLEAFNRITHVPMLLNTSFNRRGEPIVNSPQDAYRTFRRSGLDVLVLENYVILKSL